jgi:hypothetical protein
MAARKRAAAKIAEYQQLREAAHQKVDQLTRPQLKKFVSSNGPVKTGAATNDKARTDCGN